MSSSSAPQPLSAAGKPSRSASCVVAKPTRGFHMFTSELFTIGGHHWYVDYYPNGTDGAKDEESDAVSLYLRIMHNGRRVRAEYKFSLLDLAGNAAYEVPAETGVFAAAAVAGDLDCGYAGFITKEELERRRDSLLKEGCLAIRCDVGVTEVGTMPVGADRHGHRGSPPILLSGFERLAQDYGLI